MAKKQANFEQSITELEAIVAELERGQIPLEESLEKFERGVGLLRQCRTLLDTAETRIKQLVDFDENGQPKLKNLDHAATRAKESES